MFVDENNLKSFARTQWNKLSSSTQCTFEQDNNCCGFSGFDNECCSESTIGCYDYFEQQLKNNLFMVAWISIIIGVYQFGLALFSCLLVFNALIACHITLAILLLAEDLLAVFWESSEINFRFVFWMMYVFGCCVVIIDTISDCCIGKTLEGLLKIILEIIQAILFIWFTGDTTKSIFVFGSIAIVQIVIEIAIISYVFFIIVFVF